MAIIQISKIQVRSGNLVDLPQLDEAEFGWASDAKKLYIGKTTPNENIEILTSYSKIYFSAIDGSYGNLNFANVVDGQTIAYDKASNAWINTGGNALDPGNATYYSNTPIHLGNVSNVYIGGGATGYVLQTDGIGNLSWTTNGTLYTKIKNIVNGSGNVITMTVDYHTPYTNGQAITISAVQGSNTIPVNGRSFYIKVDSNFANATGVGSGNVTLYTDVGLTTTANGAGLLATANTGVATATISGSGGGTSGAGGSTYSIQYNSGGLSTGDANLQWIYSSQSLSVTGTETVSGNLSAGNLNTAGQLVSTIATGTAPLKVSSTTRVANLNVATSGVANTVNDSAQPNITSVGTLTSLSVSGNANVGNLGVSGLITAVGNITGGNLTTGGLITATGNVTAGNLVTTGLANVGSLSVTGNSNIGNLSISGLTTAAGNINGSNISVSGNVTANWFIGNVQGNITAPGANTQVIFNDSGTENATAGLTFNKTTNAFFVGNSISAVGNITGGNIIGTLITGTLTTSAQPNITSTGILTSLSVTGTVTAGHLSGEGGNISNVTAVNVGTLTNLSVTGNANVGNLYTTVISTGANTTAGTITGNWTLTTGSKLQATYADLAEYYEADQEYEPGTVLEFGGDKEVTLAQDGTTRVAGVVTTNPAYVMNTGCEGIAVAIALQGRVPVKVRGRVRKGDMLVSAGNGYARPWNNPQLGMVIGKSLENFDDIEGVIEIAVGRL